jgi:hypothetical protein
MWAMALTGLLVALPTLALAAEPMLISLPSDNPLSRKGRLAFLGWTIGEGVASDVPTQVTTAMVAGLSHGQAWRRRAPLAMSLSVMENLTLPPRDVPQAVQAGRLIGARIVLVGDIRQPGTMPVASVQAVDVATGDSLYSHTFPAISAGRIQAIGQEMAGTLVAQVQPPLQRGHVDDRRVWWPATKVDLEDRDFQFLGKRTSRIQAVAPDLSLTSDFVTRLGDVPTMPPYIAAYNEELAAYRADEARGTTITTVFSLLTVAGLVAGQTLEQSPVRVVGLGSLIVGVPIVSVSLLVGWLRYPQELAARLDELTQGYNEAKGWQ